MSVLKKCWRLTPGLAVVISVVLIALVMLDRWIEYEYTLIPQEKARQELHFRESTARMWQTVSDLMLVDNRVTTESFITSFSSDSGFENIALVYQGQILLSSMFAQQGSSTKDLSCYQSGWVNQAVTQFRPVIQLHPTRNEQLCALMPVTLRENSASLRPDSLALLVVRYDMSPAIMRLKRQIWHVEQWARHLGFALLAAFLIALVINRFVMKPLQEIRKRMQQYAQGNVLARAHLTGNCELVDLANKFNDLADQVNEAGFKVRRSEERWVKALDAAGDGVWDWDLRTHTIFYSSQWKQMLGYSEKAIGDSISEWTERVHPDDLEGALEALNQHIAGEKEVYRSTYRMRCKNGEYKWFFDRGMVFERDASGQALRVTGIHSDISDHKQVEAALQESQQQFELAMRGSNDGLWDWRMRDNQVYFSPRWKMMLGYNDGELENSYQMWESLVHPKDLKAAKEEVGRCVTGKKANYEVEFRMKHKEGHWMSILSRAIVVQDADGHVERLVGTHVDLTEIRAVQAELEESRQQLKLLAFYDALTGLPNRRLLEDRMSSLLALSSRSKHTLAVAMMDLDGFKQVNDTLGHDVGDELLKLVSERLTQSMREADTVARLGGDEFVLLFTELEQPEDANAGLDRVVQAVGQPYMIDGHECRVTASIGVAFFPLDGLTGDILLRYADLAMYRSKQAGRNRYSIYEAYMSDFDPEHQV